MFFSVDLVYGRIFAEISRPTPQARIRPLRNSEPELREYHASLCTEIDLRIPLQMGSNTV